MRLRRDDDQVREEFERFIARSTPELLRTAYLVVWDLAAAEHLVHECLTKVARHWPGVRAMEHPAAHVRRVLLNLALDDGSRRARSCAELSRCHMVPQVGTSAPWAFAARATQWSMRRAGP